MPATPITRRETLRLAAGGLGTLTLALAGCRSKTSAKIVVGSKNFTEQIILGEIVAQQIEAHTALRMERRLNLGGTLICHQAMLAAQMDVYPEYTGTALNAVLHLPSSNDPTSVYQTVRDDYRDRFDFAVGSPLGFNNTFAIVVRAEDATRLNLRAISDLSPHAADFRAGFGYEFMERSDGYPGLSKAYGLQFAASPRIMDLGLLYRALKENKVDVVAGNSTDGLIEALGMTVLEDDRRYFPPYQAVTIVRNATLRQHSGINEALNRLAGQISNEAMRHMNYDVDAQQLDPAKVAADFLRAHNL